MLKSLIILNISLDLHNLRVNWDKKIVQHEVSRVKNKSIGLKK